MIIRCINDSPLKLRFIALISWRKAFHPGSPQNRPATSARLNRGLPALPSARVRLPATALALRAVRRPELQDRIPARQETGGWTQTAVWPCGLSLCVHRLWVECAFPRSWLVTATLRGRDASRAFAGDAACLRAGLFCAWRLVRRRIDIKPATNARHAAMRRHAGKANPSPPGVMAAESRHQSGPNLRRSALPRGRRQMPQRSVSRPCVSCSGNLLSGDLRIVDLFHAFCAAQLVFTNLLLNGPPFTI